MAIGRLLCYNVVNKAKLKIADLVLNMSRWRGTYKRNRRNLLMHAKEWFHGGYLGEANVDLRIRILQAFFLVATIIMVGRLFRVQVVNHRFYLALASGQHELYRELFPERGDIIMGDREQKQYVVATNEEKFLVAADLRLVTNLTKVAKFLADTLELDELELKSLLSGNTDPYVPIKHRVSSATADLIGKEKLEGIMLLPEDIRIYPDPTVGGQILGFLGSDENGNMAGRYGIESTYDEKLRGKQGFLSGERDPAGRIIPMAGQDLEKALNGLDVVLTIDRNIQVFACNALHEAIKLHSADGGSVVIMDPKTGAIRAMCGDPDFDPNVYQDVEDISVYNNPVLFGAYEPGSVFKPFTMVAALESGLDPQTTYEDMGFVKIGDNTIWNSDLKAHGTKNLSQILEESLNTGTVFLVNSIGASVFQKYVEKFGFGEITGIDLQGETPGNISSLSKRGDIYSATGSFGQGITTTPIQIIRGFVAIANGGKLLEPYVVKEFVDDDGNVFSTEHASPKQIISERTAATVGAMLVNVVEKGHGTRAGVSGYYIAGKTGTAQVPKKDGLGYEPGLTIGSFGGFGPVDDPTFVMLVRIDHPRDVQWAESSAAPLFGKIAQFVLQYDQVRPTR